MMIDDRYVEDTRLHNKSAFLKIKPINAGKSLSALNIGLNGQEPLPIEANNLHHSRIISGSFVPKKEEPGPV